VAEALAKRDGTKWAEVNDDDAWIPPLRAFTVEWMMKQVKEDLTALGVQHNIFTSEKALTDAGKVRDAVKWLGDQGLTYTGVLEPPKGKAPDDWEPRPQLLFKATEFGDEIDRPLQKSTALGPISPATSPITRTRSTAVSKTWSTSSAPITAAM